MEICYVKEFLVEKGNRHEIWHHVVVVGGGGGVCVLGWSANSVEEPLWGLSAEIY